MGIKVLKFGGTSLANADQFRLVANIIKSDENRRTYKITRKNDEKNSYAYDILRKYGLDKESLLERSKA